MSTIGRGRQIAVMQRQNAESVYEKLNIGDKLRKYIKKHIFSQLIAYFS